MNILGSTNNDVLVLAGIDSVIDHFMCFKGPISCRIDFANVFYSTLSVNSPGMGKNPSFHSGNQNLSQVL